MRILALLLALVLAGCGSQTEPVTSACEPVMFEDTPFTHCVADPARHRIFMALDAPSGEPARSLEALAEMLPDPGDVAFGGDVAVGRLLVLHGQREPARIANQLVFQRVLIGPQQYLATG